VTRRILAKTPPAGDGTASKFGSSDLDYINKLLTGIDQSSADPVDINTAWTFADQKLKIASPSDANKVYTVAMPTLAANRTLTLPLIGANDTFVTTAFQQILTGKTIDVPSGSGGTIASVVGPDLMLYPTSYVRTGAWVGGSNTACYGFCNGVMASAGTLTQQLSATDGKYTNLTTSTSANANAGTRGGPGSAICRALNPRFFCRFRINTTSTRVFIGWHSDASNFAAAGDDPLNAKSGYLFGLRAADTNWQIMWNEGTSGTNYVDAHGGVAANTSIHTIELKGDETNTKWQYSLDGAGFADTTGAEIPATTSALYPLIQIQNGGTTPAKTFDQWHWFVQCTEPSIG
jgi:hypothetical protein